VIGNAVKVMRIATGEEREDFDPSPADQGKDPEAVALGRKGGRARVEKITPKRRAKIAKDAAKRRWAKREEPVYRRLVPGLPPDKTRQ